MGSAHDVVIENIREVKTEKELLKRAKWLEGKTLSQISDVIRKSDNASRVTTKGDVGYVIEKGFFGIEKNSDAKPDIEHLGIEIKTCPLKYNKKRDRISVKEPLSLNIINYVEEVKNDDIKKASFYKKNKKVLFVLYLHDKEKQRSEYLIAHVFLWKMSDKILDKLRPDYEVILNKIRKGKAHEIHQTDNKILTLCPKHNGNYNDPNCKRSKTPQPFNNNKLAEVRAFRIKNSYMNKIISKELGKKLGHGGWEA